MDFFGHGRASAKYFFALAGKLCSLIDGAAFLTGGGRIVRSGLENLQGQITIIGRWREETMRRPFVSGLLFRPPAPILRLYLYAKANLE
jgi:hypothetical protein